MAIDKDFVIKNGLQVNDDLIYADPSTDKVGIGTTQADKKLVVIGDSEVSQSLTVGSDISAANVNLTGILTSRDGLDVGVGGSAVSVNASNKRVGINSTSPEYTVDIRGPVSTGTNAAYIFGDVEVTGNVTAANFTGQVQGGGDITLNNLTVRDDLVSNGANVYTFFKVNKFGGNNKFRFIPRDTPPVAIGFTENTDNPTIYLSRGQNYQFDLDSSGNPFYIKTSPSVDTLNQYNDGVENNGVQVGILTFKVPYNAPNILYYQSSTDAGGGGKIILNSDGVTQTSENLTVTGTIDAQGQSDFNNINVSGTATITQLKGPNNFSVSAGIVTALRFAGISTGAEKVKINKTSNSDIYQIVFAPTPGPSGDYKELYIDDQGPQLTYDATNNKLTVGELDIRGEAAIQGVSTGSNNVLVRTLNANRKFDIPFYETSPSNPSYKETIVETESETFSYNPVSNTLFVEKIEAEKVTSPSLVGLANSAEKIGITSDTQFTNNQNARICLVTVGGNSDPDETRFDNVLITNTLKYNRGKGILFAGGFNGVGSTITNLDAGNIDRGTVDAQYLPDASTSGQGVVQLTDSINTTDSTIAATATAVKTAYDAAVADVPASRLPDASTSAQGVVQLNNTVTSTSISNAATPKALKFAFDTAIGVIPSGTRMLFYQDTAPTGWTKDTTTNIDNTAIRVTSGTDGGSILFSSGRGFTEVFKSNITVPLPQHNHGVNDPQHDHTYPKLIAIDDDATPNGTGQNQPVTTGDTLTTNKASTGITINNAGVENAQLDFSVNYVNVIICTKNQYSTAVPE